MAGRPLTVCPATLTHTSSVIEASKKKKTMVFSDKRNLFSTLTKQNLCRSLKRLLCISGQILGQAYPYRLPLVIP